MRTYGSIARHSVFTVRSNNEDVLLMKFAPSYARRPDGEWWPMLSTDTVEVAGPGEGVDLFAKLLTKETP